MFCGVPRFTQLKLLWFKKRHHNFCWCWLVTMCNIVFALNLKSKLCIFNFLILAFTNKSKWIYGFIMWKPEQFLHIYIKIESKHFSSNIMSCIIVFPLFNRLNVCNVKLITWKFKFKFKCFNDSTWFAYSFITSICGRHIFFLRRECHNNNPDQIAHRWNNLILSKFVWLSLLIFSFNSNDFLRRIRFFFLVSFKLHDKYTKRKQNLWFNCDDNESKEFTLQVKWCIWIGYYSTNFKRWIWRIRDVTLLLQINNQRIFVSLEVFWQKEKYAVPFSITTKINVEKNKRLFHFTNLIGFDFSEMRKMAQAFSNKWPKCIRESINE